MTATPPRPSDLARGVAREFRALTGHDPAGVWSAPGRVNLIGEHTDYNEGFALPFALGLRTAVAVGRRHDGLLCATSRQHPDEAFSVPIGELAPGSVSGWAAYVAGVVWALLPTGLSGIDAAGIDAAGIDAAGLDVVVDGRVPLGAGLASSAALECATALGVSEVWDLGLGSAELARCAQRAENDFVGVPCGLMDQVAAMEATAGHALYLDARAGTTEKVPFDPAAAGLTLLVIDTHARHAHGDGDYAERRASCQEAAARLGVAALRDVDAADLGGLTRRLADAPVLRRRARHVVTENARTLQAVALLRAGTLAGIGPLLSASHASLRDDLEVSTAELDCVVDAAHDAGALGARLTGGGFGGSAIALVPVESAEGVAAAIAAAASAHGFPTPSVSPAVPSSGARREPDAFHLPRRPTGAIRAMPQSQP